MFIYNGIAKCYKMSIEKGLEEILRSCTFAYDTILFVSKTTLKKC